MKSAEAYLRRQYLCLLRRCAWNQALNTFVGVVAAIHGVAASAQAIVVDGRTQTQVSVNGAVTDVSTQTVRGPTGFNSFSRFNVESATTVNLHLPDQTRNLLNLVHDEQSSIHGMVNAYQDGHIGGNVFFLNPHGIVVGKQGVLNVGSLTLATPTPAFMNELVAPGGEIGQAATDQALAGSMPLSESGLVRVQGRINATEAVTLAGGSVDVATGAQVLAGARARVAFAELVNVQGVAPAAAVQVDGGVIRIVAAQDVAVAGQVSADGLASGGDGGSVRVMAERNADLQAGAVVSANAGDSGDGGFVEFSAQHTVNLAGGSLQARAPQGVAGAVLIDPANLNIGSDLLRSTGGNTSSDGVSWDAGSLTLEANQNLSVADGVVVSTRDVAGGSRNDHINGASQGASGALTLKAAHIALGDGAMLLAQGDANHAGGDVKVLATDINAVGASRNADASILAKHAVVKGRDVTIAATADTSLIAQVLEANPAISAADAQSYLSSELDDLSDGPGGEYLAIKTTATAKTEWLGSTVQASGEVNISAQAGARAGFEKKATATVLVGDHVPAAGPTVASHISGQKVNISSQSDTSLTFNVLGKALRLADQSWLPDPDSGTVQLLDDQLFDFSGVPLVALSESRAKTNVSGASVVQAVDSLDISAEAVSVASPSFASPLLFSAAWGESTAVAETWVEGSSALRSGGKTTVKAGSDVEMEVTATVNSVNKPVDATFARGKNSITTRAVVGDQTSTVAGELELLATTESELSVVAESKNAGGSGVGLAVAVNVSDTETTATLGGDVTTNTGDVKVAATTDISQNNTSANAATLGNPSSLSAKITNFKAGIQRNVVGSVLGATGLMKQGTADKLTQFMFPGIKEGKFNASGAVTYSDSTNTANASIANQASVKSAGRVDVLAHITDRPSASVGAKSTSTGTAIGGSAVVADFANHAHATIGNQAVVDAQSGLRVDAQTLVPYPWQIDWSSPEVILEHLQGSILDLLLTSYAINSAKGKEGLGLAVAVSVLGMDNKSKAEIGEGARINTRYTQALEPALDLSQQAVNVYAKNEVNSVNAVGILSKKFLGSSGGKAAVGGSGNFLNIDGEAVAGIRDGADVRAVQDVDVKAESVSQLITVTEAGGSSDKVGLEGALSANTVHTDTVAYIDDKARVEAGGNVQVEAVGDLEMVSVAGGVVATKGPVGIGMSVSLNTVESQVAAYIGNHDPLNDTAPATGVVRSGGDLAVKAKAYTEIGAYSVAGALATQSSAQTTAPSDAGETQDGSGSAAGGSAGKGKFGIAMSGDASVNDIQADTLAYVADGVQVQQARHATLDAHNTLAINALAGAVSISTQPDGNGLAGSYAQNSLAGNTAAYIDNASLTQAGDLNLKAEVSGNIKTLSASVAGAKGKAGVAGSVSINDIGNQTQAYVVNTTLSGVNNASIRAYDHSGIQSVAGALAFGGKAGVGLSFALNKLHNKTLAHVDDSDLEAAGTLNLSAETDNSIDTITAALGLSKGTMAAAGSVSINTIENETRAYVSGKKTAAGLDAHGGVAIDAQDQSNIFAVSGSIGASAGKTGVGAAVAWSEVNNTVEAGVRDGADVAASAGGVAVKATANTEVEAIAAAGSLGDKVAVAGSFSAVQTENTVSAQVNAARVQARDQVELAASDTARLNSTAGSAALSGGAAAVGIAAAYNVIENRTEASATDAQLSGAGVQIKANEDADIRSIAVGGSGGAKVAVAGSLGINQIDNTTLASATRSSLNSTGGDTQLLARDSSEILSITGAAAVGGNGAVGAAGSYNRIGGDVKAEISGGTAAGEQVLVQAQRAATLDVWAISGSGAGTAGFAGSIALNDAGGSTTARVADGAHVNASGNVLVAAQADDKIASKAGAVGLGGSLGAAGGIAFNDLHASTLAEVTGANTQVSALGQGAALQVDAGALKTTGELQDRREKDSVRGVAVLASSTAEVENAALSAAGGGSAAVAATVSVAMVGGSTTAQLSDGARLNTAFGGAEQAARVAAYHHDKIVSGTGGAAIGGDAGVGGAADTAVVSHNTTARVQDARAQATKAVALDAGSSTDITQGVIAVGGGTYAGLAGTVGVVLLDGSTQALAENARLDSQGSLKVQARSDTDVDLKAGALAVSGAAGVGITAAVTVAEQNTQARVSGSSALNANGNTLVNAASDFKQHDYAYTAAAAGGAGIAGTVNVVVLKGSTDAVVGAGVGINADNAYGGAEQDVHVTASDRSQVDNKVGSLGIGLGGAGVGAVADVVLVHNGASARVDSGASITADRHIRIAADATRDVNSISTAIAGGYTAGIAGAVSVISVGARPEGDAKDNSSGSVGKAGDMASASATGDQMGSEGGPSAARADSARQRVNVAQDLDAAPNNSSAAASVASGATLKAGGDVEVHAHNRTDTDAIAVGAAASGGFSLGGAIAIATVQDKTVASLQGNTTAGGRVSVRATDDQSDASLLRTYAGGGGLAGLAASLAWHQKSSTALAEIGGTVNAVNGAVTVDAGLDHDLQAEGVAAAVGVVGVGASIAHVTESGEASAQIRDGAQITARSLDVHGHSQTDSDADVIAASGGLFSGAGADANAKDTSSAQARIGNNAVIRTATGLTQVRADVDPLAKANAVGVAVAAGAGIGVSMADALVQTRAVASTGSAVDVVAQGMTVLAETRMRSKTAESDAMAAAGGLLLGASATDSKATARTYTASEVGAGNQLRVAGTLRVDANSDTSVDADVTGISVGGLLAAGSNAAKAQTDTQTYATVGDNPTLAAGTLQVRADGSDRLRANTLAGAGGLGVVVASKSETDADARTYARLGGASGSGGQVDAAQVELTAAQHVNFDSRADSTSASAVGFSGARATNRVDTDTRATVGRQLTVNTGGFDAQAWNDIVKPALASGYNVDSGSGGLLNGAAARSESTIRNNALVELENAAQVAVAVAGDAVGQMDLAAWNKVRAYDRVRLDSGGAVAIAKAESVIQNDRNNALVKLGADATLLSDGEANLSTRTDAQIHATAHSKTYGLAGASEGDSVASIGANNRVELAAGAKVEAEGDVHLMAGTNRQDGNDLYADAETRLWNYTALPVENDPEAYGSVTQYNTVNVAQGAQVRSVQSVHLTASEGRHRTRGFGEGTDAYRETLAAIGDFFGADTSSLKITGGSTYDNANVPLAFLQGADPASGVNVDGTVQAGIRHHQWLTLAADGSTVDTSEGMADKWRLRDNVNLATELAAEIAALTGKASQLRAAADSYAGTDAADAALALDNDARILQQQLDALRAAPLVGFIDILDTTARSGNVRITGKYLTGAASGAIEAPGDVRIDIENQSTRFMQTQKLTIPDEGGGLITFNGLSVGSNGAINDRNAVGKTANFGSLLNAETSPKPVIRVENTNSRDAIPDSPAQLWMRGDVNNLGGEAIAKSHGTLRVSANINAETVNIATGGDFIKTYTPGFTHQGGDPIAQLGSLPDTREGAKADYSQNGLPLVCSSDPKSCSTTIAGNNVYISGQKLNINGVIQAGLPDRQMVIDNGLIGGANAGKISAARSAWLANPGTAERYLDLNNPAPESSTIKVRYDAQNDRLELDNVRMGGGHMELFGDIFSTGNGELRVMDGYGRINVSNTTHYDIAVGKLDTGPGVEGLIHITDTSQRDRFNQPLVTEITRLGDTITTHTSATVDADGKPTTLIASTSGRDTTFQPLTNRRFNWINGERTQTDEDRVYTTRVLFGIDFLWPDSDPPDSVSTSNVYTARLTGDWLSTGGGSADYAMDYSKYTSGPYKYKNDYTTRNGVLCIEGACAKEDITTHKYFRTVVNEYYQHSLNASKEVKVKFTGFDTADLRVDAGTGQLLLGGLVRGLTGDTTLSAGAGIQSLSDDARIVASQLNMTSANGAIGSAAAPVQINLTDADPGKGLVDGVLTASAPLGVAIKEIGGEFRVASVQANQGDVFLTADRLLRGTTGGTTVSGVNLNLVSLSGQIGGLATPLLVDNLGGAGTLSASAAGDIHLSEATGDMRVQKIQSQAGNVSLAVPDGKLLDANTVEQVDESTRAELLALWDEMRLRGAAAEQARERNLEVQAAKRKQAYEDYFRMRNLQQVGEGGTTADAYNANYRFKTSAEQASELKTANGWTDAQVSAYEDQQTTAYHAAYQRFGGGDYVANYNAVLDDSEKTALSKGAVWSDAQLSNALAVGLLRPVSDTDIRIEESNVIGQDIHLVARDGIGLEKAAAVVIRRGTDLGTLDDDQKLALLTAERSDIELVGDEIRIRQKEDVDITVTGRLKASAQGDVLLGSEGNVLVDQLLSTGELRLKTGAGIQGVAGNTHVIAQRAILEAGSGDLGSAATPILVDLSDSGTLAARAGRDLHVREISGDMVVDSVFAKGDVYLTADQSLVEARADRALDVRGDSLNLVAGNTIGRPGGDNALDVAVDALGRIDASAPHGIYLNSTGGTG
ncbi:leukotoxin LktA family filamentous adhesin, partial [Hydrogenophaga sp.]|uniref:leukotoxin LktA family filamentous adhesin n=1 Tax=Hydrogenophaga sp. TaxID=1904254 RepID=UPI0035637C3C